MGDRGRMSAAELAVVPGGKGAAHEPPAHLSDEAQAEWRAIVADQPAGWLTRGMHVGLEALCNHTVAARRVAQLISQCQSAEQLDTELHDQLLRQQLRETGRIATLMRQLGLSATTSPGGGKVGKAKKFVPPPWYSSGHVDMEEMIARDQASDDDGGGDE